MLGSIRFAGDLSPWLVIAAAGLGAVLVALIYLRESASLAAPYNYLLPALRASSVALVILVLAGPVWHRRYTVGTLGRIVFAVDQSESMSVDDSSADTASYNRLSRALRLLTGSSSQPGWLDTLSKSHDIDVVAFSSGDPITIWSTGDDVASGSASIPSSTAGRPSDNPTESGGLTGLVPSGVRTDLSSSLQMMQASGDGDAAGVGQSKAALVLMTDGRSNEGPSATDLATSLHSAGIEVHTIGIGSPDEPDDVMIVRVERPDTVAADGTLVGSIMVGQSGMDGRELSVRVESNLDGSVLWQSNVVSDGRSQQTVPFSIAVEPIVDRIHNQSVRGVQRSTEVLDLRAVVEPMLGESTTANNSFPFRTAASIRDRRMLILDGSSRWEVRYLRNLFERDPAWEVDTLLFGPGTDMPRLRRGSQSGEFPDSRESISRYDVVVLGEIPIDPFEATDAVRLREFVSRGGGLIVIDGRYDRIAPIANKFLSDLIPVRHQDRMITTVESLLPTAVGLDQPTFHIGGDPADLEPLWQQLPVPTTVAAVTAQEGAEVWAEVQDADAARSPWLVTRLFGAGRVFYLAADQTWRWRYKVADRFHARFWNQLVAAAMQPPYSSSDEYAAIGTDKIEYSPSESPVIRARLQDTGGKAVGDATVDALIIANDQVVATVPLSVDDPARGTYQGSAGMLAEGAYQIRIRASGFDASALQASTPIWVGQWNMSESSPVGLDASGLAEIASAGGGVYLHESSAAQILERLKPLSSGTIVDSDIVVWQSFYWFWAVIVLLGVEWLMRKRAGLV
ncbi:VWA domain-containing protein [Rubripirellula lacrimiformis]|nr:VWA domain-containing protein [Rubripirellula lacrimiformis]